MAEKTATPKEYELDNKEMDSNSAENPHSPTGARRHSPSDKPDTTKRRVPIHLRASAGSCHDLCKFGKSHYSDEITKLPFRKRNSKSLPNVAFKTTISEPSRPTASKSSPNDPKSVKPMASGVQNTKKIAPLANFSPRQSALSGNKTSSPKLSCSVSETPEIIKQEILLFPSENVESPVEEGSSNGNKTLRTDKKMSDQSANCSSSEKPKSIKPRMLIASGRNMMSSVASAEKSSESLTAFVSSKFYLGKTVSSKAREEAGKVKLPLSSPVNHRSGTEKSNGEGLEKTLHVIKTETEKARKTGGAKLSSPPRRSMGIRNSKTEAESNASTSTSLPVSSSRAKFPSLSSRAKSLSLPPRVEKDRGVGIQNTVSIKIEENHVRAKSLSSSSHEDVDDEMIDHSKNEADELIEDHDTDPSSSSSHEEDDEEEEEEEMYPSSSASSSVSSLEENDEETNGELVSDKTMSSNENWTSLRKSQSVRSEDKDNHSAVKLKFRRGKIIDIQAENNVPKRLKFRRVRNGGKTNRTDDCAPDGKKSIVTETGNVNPETPSKKTLRKAGSFVSDNKKNSMDVKPGMPNRSLRKSRSVASEEKYCSSVSLSRREKTVDPQTDNNSPTRLKFARGRVSRDEDAKSDSLRKNIKRVGDDNKVAGDESPRNVVLKHPEVQMKNNGQVLLNNVIKETASKLVESRKSKVKALVGAFETVISLHETRPGRLSTE